MRACNAMRTVGFAFVPAICVSPINISYVCIFELVSNVRVRLCTYPSPVILTTVYNTGMGELEKRTKAIVKRTRVRDAVLLSLHGASVLALATLAPNALRLLTYVDMDIARKRNPTGRIKEAALRLEARGLIVRVKSAKGFSFQLTEKGARQAELLVVSKHIQTAPRTWDRRWRIIMFDVWEHRRATRERLRTLLKHIGFIRLQDSVWVYPYPCEEFVALARADLRLGNGMVYLIAEGIENDTRLRRHFGLPS